MSNYIYRAIGEPLSVFCDGKEVIRNFVITSIEEECRVPPFDCILYPFEAECSYVDFQYFDSFNRQVMFLSPQKFIINMGEDIPFHIDSFNMYMPSQQSSFDAHSFIPIKNNRTIINGHFDSRDLDIFSPARSNRFKIKKPEPINNRWEILDL